MYNIINKQKKGNDNMNNVEKIKALQDVTVQWTEMQNDLFDHMMKGVISEEEYKERNAILNEYIDEFKIEIHELAK